MFDRLKVFHRFVILMYNRFCTILFWSGCIGFFGIMIFFTSNCDRIAATGISHLDSNFGIILLIIILFLSLPAFFGSMYSLLFFIFNMIPRYFITVYNNNTNNIIKQLKIDK